MNGIASIGKLIIFVGIGLIIFGAIVLLLSRVSGGRGGPLPGDIVIRRDNVTIYFPIVTSIIVSIILTVFLMLFTALRR